jgi:hypothetical protein
MIALYFVYDFILTPSALRWVKGQSQSYSIDITSDLKGIDFAKGTPWHSRSVIKGVLNFRVYDVTDSKVKTGFRFEPETVEINNQTMDRLKNIYSHPFFVDFTPDGRPEKIRVSNKIARDDEKYIRSLIENIQYIQLKGRKWKVEENDINGTFMSMYASTWGGVSKKRIALKQGKDFFSPVKDIKVLRSNYKYKFDRSCSWIYGLDASEKWRMSGTGADSTGRIKIKAALKSTTIDDSILAVNIEDYEKILQEYGSSPKNNSSVVDEIRLEGLAGTIKKGDYLNFIALMKRGAISDRDFANKMADYFKLYPEDADVVARLIKGRSVNDKTANLIMHAMGYAGTPSCQRALVSLASDSGISADNRLKAAVYLGNVKNPDPVVAANLRNFNYNFNDQNSSLISSAMINTIGSMAGDIGSDDPLSETLNNILRERLNSSDAGIPEKSSVLHAIGNTGNPVFIGEINKLRKDPSSMVRSAAMDALASIDGGQAEQALLNTLLTDEDSLVRKRAIRSQSQREYSDTFTREVMNIYGNEQDVIVRLEIVDYLRSNRNNNSSIVPFLTEALKNEKDGELRTKIIKAIHTSL